MIEVITAWLDKADCHINCKCRECVKSNALRAAVEALPLQEEYRLEALASIHKALGLGDDAHGKRAQH